MTTDVAETFAIDMDGAGGGAGAIWSKACSALKGELGDDTFGSWIAPARLRRGNGGGLVVVTPTGLARDWIRRNAWRRLGELWTQNDPERRRLDLKSRLEFEDDGAPSRPAASAATAAPSVTHLPLRPAAAVPVAASERPAGLNERFTFDSFVAGPSNEFALGVARRVASWADGCFNPVFFHGPYGFGKTHLLNAIAWEAARTRPGARIVYLTAERFTSTFSKALADKATPGFKSDFRSADLLLVDDVQFIGGKRYSEEELFHTLAALIGEGRRVVFAADRPASLLTEVDARLRSHLAAGLVCGIESGDRALRLGILERKLALLSHTLELNGTARPEVLAFLADRFTDSVRELEGGLYTLVARAGERLSKLTLDEAQAIVRPHLREVERRITVDDIQKATADHYGLKQSDLLCERRTRAVARPRHVAMYLAKTLTTRSYPDIGRRFGGRDHTTVLHGVRRIEQLKAEDSALTADLEALVRKLKG